MKKILKKRVGGQALALVLIVIAISVVIAFAITSRVIEDIKQQGEEKSSTRAEALSESATEKITQMILSGELSPTNTGIVSYSVGDSIGEGDTGKLDICKEDSDNLETKCDPKSSVEIAYYKMILQFKLFNSESIEVHLVHPDVQAHKNDTSPSYSYVKRGNDTAILVHVRNPSEERTTSYNGSHLMVKSFWRTNPEAEVRLSAECVINLQSDTASCLPKNALQIAVKSCEAVKLTGSIADGKKLGDKCYTIRQASGNGISFYRLKPLLVAPSESNDIPYVDISVTGIGPNNFDLPEYQMAFINAGVYSGENGSDSQVFQQTTRLMLIHKSVPEIADYVLYNGSDQPITKE